MVAAPTDAAVADIYAAKWQSLMYHIHLWWQWYFCPFSGASDRVTSCQDCVLKHLMVTAIQQGLVRSIGVSNFSARKLQDILAYATVPPAVCQVSSLLAS